MGAYPPPSVGQGVASENDRKGGEALSRFHHRRDEWAKPFYDLTCDMARFAPPPPESLALYEAFSSRPTEASRFLGMITEATAPAEFFWEASCARYPE